VVIALGAALILAVGLVMRERSGAHRLVPRELVADRQFTASTAGGALLNFAFYGELFFLSLFLQQERGLDALHTGLAFLPQPLLFMAVSPMAGRLVASRGPRLPLAVGAALGAAGAFALLGVDGDSPYGVLMAGLSLSGLGAGLAVPAVTAGVMGSAPASLAGIASAALNAGRQIGGVLGVAVLGGLATGAAGVETSAMHAALVIAGIALLLASVVAFALPGARSATVRERLALATE
jgi:DHA2 family methylenomycin A resistance protein-like MFS transporter